MKSIILKIIPFLLSASLFFTCTGQPEDSGYDLDYRNEMRKFVIAISQYAKTEKEDFLIISQNGLELVERDDGNPAEDYLSALDGNGQEDLFYGYQRDDKATKRDISDYLIHYLQVSRAWGNRILVTDYSSTPENMDDSYRKNNSSGFISFAADSRSLNRIPEYPAQPYNENPKHIKTLAMAENLLYIINPENYATKDSFIRDMSRTNYDLIIMDLFSNNGTPFKSEEILSLKKKQNGGSRLVICYMSIGEAEDYRYYWNPDWEDNNPSWLEDENSRWKGNYKVRYWDPEWQKIIYGNGKSYLQMILDAGFDGVYMDIIDAFEYFE